MGMILKARFRNGVLTPLGQTTLRENQEVTLLVADGNGTVVPTDLPGPERLRRFQALQSEPAYKSERTAKALAALSGVVASLISFEQLKAIAEDPDLQDSPL